MSHCGMKRKVPRTPPLGCVFPSDLQTVFAKTIITKKRNENKTTKPLYTTQIGNSTQKEIISSTGILEEEMWKVTKMIHMPGGEGALWSICLGLS